MLNFILIAVLVQQITTIAFDIFSKKKNRSIRISSIIISVIIVLNTNLNLISTVLGITENYSIIGKLITAMLLSNGPAFLKKLYDSYLSDSNFK